MNAKLGTQLGFAVGVQHVGGRIVMETGTETEFVYPMVNAFPAIHGRLRAQLVCPNLEWKGIAATVLGV